MKKHAIPVITLVLAVVLAVVAVPAFAGGNGEGGQNDNAPAAGHAPGSSDAPGNSGDAPGQEKKARQAPPSAAGSAGVESMGHGQTNKEDGAAKARGQGKKMASSAGVKPSNSTSHNVSASAGSNATKLYGNGQTAGRIATANGASADTPLYGPGNSQPHKTTPCGQAAHGNGGGYDVHALKSHARRTDCADTPASDGKPTKDPVVATSPSPQNQPTGDAQSPGGHEAAARSTSGGVIGAVASTTGTTLPFTGLPLWLAVLAAIAATGIGLALRHQARAIA